jgi:hypothetical protein
MPLDQMPFDVVSNLIFDEFIQATNPVHNLVEQLPVTNILSGKDSHTVHMLQSDQNHDVAFQTPRPMLSCSEKYTVCASKTT